MTTTRPEDESALARKPRILLLDDDVFMLRMQARMLENLGYEGVTTATDADDALVMLNRLAGAIDIIVCDLNMPGTDGIAFLQQVAAGGLRVHVVLLSGEGARVLHAVRKVFEAGRLVVLGTLEKPAGRFAMQSLLERWKPWVDAPLVPASPVVDDVEIQQAGERGEWIVHYQPKVDLRDGELVGFEALVRWNHPRHGLLYPDRFIERAEAIGMIETLTDIVLDTAMRQLSAWRGQGLDVTMAINLSMRSLDRIGFSGVVGAIAKQCGVTPSHVMLEITESRLMSVSPMPLENLVRLRLQRFGMSIDDFGTGHSSLAQLRDIPFTELKVDKGFVRGARDDPIVRPILEGSVGIARRMEMRCVAEGVETEDEWRLMQELGCHVAQGYFIGRPMPVASVQAWLDGWNTRRASLAARGRRPIHGRL